MTVKRSGVRFLTVTFKYFFEAVWFNLPLLSSSGLFHAPTPTQTQWMGHMCFSDRLVDKPLTFALQSHRSISRPFFHVMFTSLWAIWSKWWACLWSTTCAYNNHFQWCGTKGGAHQRSTLLWQFFNLLELVRKTLMLKKQSGFFVVVFADDSIW